MEKPKDPPYKLQERKAGAGRFCAHRERTLQINWKSPITLIRWLSLLELPPEIQEK